MNKKLSNAVLLFVIASSIGMIAITRFPVMKIVFGIIAAGSAGCMIWINKKGR